MAISALELFKIGVGPSSSHTMGPMLAGALFADRLATQGRTHHLARIQIELFGSLAATGVGHATDRAVVAGLLGMRPESVDPDDLVAQVAQVRAAGMLRVAGRDVDFEWRRDILFRHESLPRHPNALAITTFAADGAVLDRGVYYSVGGGFVVDETGEVPLSEEIEVAVELPFASGEELLRVCDREGISVAQLMARNETAWRSTDETRGALLKVWTAMQDCVARGIRQEGVLPGGLLVPRRAPGLYRRLQARDDDPNLISQTLPAMDWVNLYALAVNEENAAGGRVVTAPTNGAAGIIPAVLHYYVRYHGVTSSDDIVDFLLAAAAIGSLIKRNASISGAEVGCQGEVGSACAMAAAGLAQVLGGTPAQVENAAEIGLEHNLGLTCDPISGLVQLPCIERNAMAAVKAINAAQLALNGDGCHSVSLDQAIWTMRDTGRDMLTKYKETSQGGLAVAYTEC